MSVRLAEVTDPAEIAALVPHVYRIFQMVSRGAALGWAQMSRRLRHRTTWDPGRTFAFASIGSTDVVRLAGPGTLNGLRGAAADGGTWQMDRHSITHAAARL